MRRTVAIIGTRGYPSYYGGFETAVRHLAPYLVEHGWNVDVYGRHGACKVDDPQRDPRVTSRITRGVETKSLSTLSYGLTASVDALRRKPDVALVMNVANGFWLPMLRARGIPSLVNVDGIEWDRAKWGTTAKKMFKAGARLTATHGTRLVFDAKEIGRRWQDDFGRDGVFIPYGGDEIAGQLPVEPGLTHRKYALMVARFVAENTVSEFVHAASQISRRHDVVIVGSSGYHSEFDERVDALSRANRRVTWLGHLSSDQRLHSLWQHAGAYFHGHSVGGTNPALVQAMAAGAPVLARDTVYNREVLAGSGMFVKPCPIEITHSVLDLVGSPSKQEAMSQAARKRAREHYSWSEVCRRYEESLAELADAGRRSVGRRVDPALSVVE
jgi:glycosyltransferase involved in cell wall biosynthesis